MMADAEVSYFRYYVVEDFKCGHSALKQINLVTGEIYANQDNELPQVREYNCKGNWYECCAEGEDSARTKNLKIREDLAESQKQWCIDREKILEIRKIAQAQAENAKSLEVPVETNPPPKSHWFTRFFTGRTNRVFRG